MFICQNYQKIDDLLKNFVFFSQKFQITKKAFHFSTPREQCKNLI